MKPIRVGSVELPAPVFLAPMSGISDAPFRRLATRLGAPVVVSEMVACQELAQNHPESVLRAENHGGFPHVVQLAGREARWMAEGARRAVGAGADIVDINMGCPARKVTSGYSGSALMRDLDLACRLIEATVEAASVPVTLKMRLGWDGDSLNAPELARRAEALGVRMITVHGRTRCQFYEGRADWTAVRATKAAVSVPVIVNGDIEDVASARQALEASGADGVMIGRGACGRPWIVGAVAEALLGRAGTSGAPADMAGFVAAHHEAMLDHYGAKVGLRMARKHLGWYLDRAPMSEPERADARRRLMSAQEPETVLREIAETFGAERERRAA
nr:tRNA dihydrouridine synthase DusB [Lutibaculum baratangense]